MFVFTLPYKAIYLIILLVSLTQNVSGKSAGVNLVSSPVDSLETVLNDWQQQDSLLPWLSALKSQSQNLRTNDDMPGAVSLLSRCIDEAWREPIGQDETIQMGWVYVNRAYIYDQKYGDFLAAKKDYLTALDYFGSVEYSNYYVAAYLIMPLGNIYTRLGENQQSIVMLEELQRICRQENQISVLMSACNDLGRAHMNKDDYGKALALFDEAVELDSADFYNLGLIKSSKAEAQLYLGDYENGILTAQNALSHLQQAIRKMEENDFRYEACGRYLTGVHTVLGRLYLKTKAFEASLEQFRLAWEKTLVFYRGKHRRKSKILIGLGDCYSQKGDYEQGIQHYQEGLIAALIGFDETDVMTNPSDSILFADVVISEALTGKARAAYLLFNHSEDSRWLQLTVDTYLTYFRWVKKLQAEQLNVQSKLDLTTEIHGIAEETLSAVFHLKSLTGDKELSKIAFQVMEQTRGILLSESDRASLLSGSNVEMEEALQELNRLKMQKSLFEISLTNADSTMGDQEKQRKKLRIEELDREIQISDFNLKETYPLYSQITAERKDSINFQSLETYLTRQNCDLLAYFLGDEHLYLIVYASGEFLFRELDLKAYKSVAPKFIEQLYATQKSSADKYYEQALELYKILLGDSADKLGERWLILPDGELNLIPFEALVDQGIEDNNVTYKNMSYVLRNHSVFYAPSVKFVLQDKQHNVPGKTYLGIAPAFENSVEFAHLSNSAAEVTYARDLFSGEVLLNEQATKKAFIEKANAYELIHLSTHAGSGSGKNNDGWIAFLTKNGHEKMLTPELLQMNLSARLVVLNGCETGAGEIYKGEGMLSMARGFIQAGARSTITNLWQVNHASNTKLMEYFYRQLESNQSPAVALKNAKLDYLNDQDIDNEGAHPFYWAAPVLIGTNHEVTFDTLSKTSHTTTLWIIPGALALASILFLSFRKRRK